MIRLRHNVIDNLFGKVTLKDEDIYVEIERIQKKTKIFFFFDGHVNTRNFKINDNSIIEHTYFPERYIQILVNCSPFVEFIIRAQTLGNPEFEITNPHLRIENPDWLFHNYKVYYSDNLMYKCSKKLFKRYYNIEIVNKKYIEESIAIAIAIDMLCHDGDRTGG
ncbi:hypothetical protein RBH29_08140 [Herbivorax sp. ANBcel31]|uniref:hypothetical protein n=1 Tax=Herbivorax sp. ANBcel31 TaxID=3069754 RepID=UPI0027B46772|nr:hypothetical protein [Herbivorax sp. ANBcel31]MDQ2086398.1 hypothetical protein [Herbivorax sp. ANBcel31]